MALCVLFNCPCGERLSVFLPKALVFGEWMADDNERWAAVDAEEELDGEIELARAGAEATGARFVDGRESLTCPVCGVDVGAMVKDDMQGGRR